MYATRSGIYRIDLGGDGWVYYGSTNHLGRRMAAHLSGLMSGRHENSKMQRVFDKYGVFEFVVREFCPVSELHDREQLLLDANEDNPWCANIAFNVLRPSLGRKLSAATRGKMSDHQKTSPIAKAHLATITALNVGSRRSDDCKLKMSESMKNSPAHIAYIERRRANPISRPHNEMDREKMSVAQTARWARERSTGLDVGKVG